jgi:hypothetical protein
VPSSAAQIAQERQPGRRGDVLQGLEDHGAGLVLLRDVHRDVGVAQQRLGVGAVPRGDDDADAGLHVERHPLDVEGTVQRHTQSLRDAPGLADAVHERQQDGELVAAEPGDGVAVAEDRPQARAHLAEQLVPVRVPEAVVDLLEAVQVDQEQGDLAGRAAGRGQALVELVAQQFPVRQAGECVVGRLVAVPLGGGQQGLGLPAQPLRRRRDQAEDDDVEDGEADAQRDRHGAHVLADGGGHRRIGQVELDDAVRAGGAVVLQRNVDLEQLVLAVLAAGPVVGGVGEAGDDVAGESGAQLTGIRRLADELGALGVVEDRPVGGVDLELDRIEGGQLVAHRPELLGGVVDSLLHTGQAPGVEPVGQVGLGELRLETEAHRHQGRILSLLAGAVLDGAAQHGGEHRPHREREQQADRAEARQQAGAPQPAEEAHAVWIGWCTRFLE